MKSKGFTMIELIVAIAIMGVLMIIAVPSITFIQSNNKDAKYVTYEKSIRASSQLYVDNYNQDLFGVKNTGCAVITYEDLKEKDMIEDLQLKDVYCGGESEGKTFTYVFVRKSKNGNYNYDTHMTCRNDNYEIVYGEGPEEINLDSCSLEDGEGPQLTIKDSSEYAGNEYYYLNQKPKLSVTISDDGVGLKEDQEITYQWYKDSNKIGDENTIKFNNKNYASSVTRKINLPDNMEDPDENTTYQIVFYGELEDVDNNKTIGRYEKIRKGWSYTINYFVGKVIIHINSNGGSLKSPYNSKYSLKNDYVYINNSTNIIHTIKYGKKLSSSGLINWNNEDYLNLSRAGYYIDDDVWNTKANGTGTNYNQTSDYSYDDFCKAEDVHTKGCEITLYANWKLSKPKTPVITITSPKKFTTNKYKENWTKSNIKWKVSTSTDASLLGYWYYKVDDGKYKKFNNKTKQKTIYPRTFTCANNKVVNEKYTYKVCNIKASGANDTNNCSDEVSEYVRIDKAKPTYVITYKTGDYWKNGSKHYYQIDYNDSGCGIYYREGITISPPHANVSWGGKNESFNGARSTQDILATSNNPLTVRLNKLCDLLNNCTSGLPVSRSCNYGNKCK